MNFIKNKLLPALFLNIVGMSIVSWGSAEDMREVEEDFQHRFVLKKRPAQKRKEDSIKELEVVDKRFKRMRLTQGPVDREIQQEQRQLLIRTATDLTPGSTM